MQIQNLVPFYGFLPNLQAQCKISASTTHLQLSFKLSGDVDGIAWFAPVMSEPVELWRHSCFEFFEFDEASEAYCEWNFSVHKEWKQYFFESYRKAAPQVTQIGEPKFINLNLQQDHLVFEIEIPKAFKESAFQSTLILDSKNQEQDYYALTHGTKADFHKRLPK